MDHARDGDGGGRPRSSSAPPALADPAWAVDHQQVLHALRVTPRRGLPPHEVTLRRATWGPNRLREIKRRSVLSVLVEQFKSLLAALLAAALIVALVFGQWVEGIAIAAVLVINAAIGFFMELRAIRSMDALRQLGSTKAKVRRDGRVHVVAAKELVVGDIVLVEGGDVITADLRLIEASKLQVNESALTGESLPVSKGLDRCEQTAQLDGRTCMLFKGTTVSRGSAEGVVVAVGMQSELGQISRLVEEAVEEQTPLERRLNRLGRGLAWVTLAVATLVIATGILSGMDLYLIIETGIALAVATVPEGLPIIATIALARGMQRMASHNALVNRLSAVETLGATSILCTDKTGTLTENRLTVTRLVLAEGEVEVVGRDDRFFFEREGESIAPEATATLRQALTVAVLCNNAALNAVDGVGAGSDDASGVGDPLEVALLAAGAAAGLVRPKLLLSLPEEREIAFDPEQKLMATVHADGSAHFVAVKGAPEVVLDICSHELDAGGKAVILGDDRRAQWRAQTDVIAAQGLRVLGLASKVSADGAEPPYEGLTWIGLVGLMDPPRPDVRQAIEACRAAGLRVVMVTGDQSATARFVARAVGLSDSPDARVVTGGELTEETLNEPDGRQRFDDVDMFSRVSPKQKLELIALHQARGAVVAMTGDGVNDAPALKKADIGIAMGRRGTDVAREAAEIILKDDALATIVVAIRQGRVIFDNIRNFVVYLLSCNLSEVLIIALATVAGAPLPLWPLQILFLNLVTDVFPALALGLGEGDPRVMQRAPRPRSQPIVGRDSWLTIVLYALLLTGAVLTAFAIALRVLHLDQARAVTVAFLTLALAQTWHVFNIRQRLSPLLRNEITRNPYVWGAIAICLAALAGALYIPLLREILGLLDPGPRGWFVVGTLSLAPLVVGQLSKRGRS